jgi:hypothetical protein
MHRSQAAASGSRVTRAVAAGLRWTPLQVGLLTIAVAITVIVVWLTWVGAARAAVNTAPPAAPVKLIFIHHSTGEAWLADGHGGLAIALRDNRYFVSDTNYGWGSELPSSRGDAIGSTTDIGDWYTWFRGPSSAAYAAALFAESDRHSSYTRLASDPGGENEIVMFKSCFPNSDLHGSASDPVPDIADNPLKGQACGGDDFTVANAKGIYLDLLPFFAAHQDKLFVAVVAPPICRPSSPTSGRALADWLVNDWLDGYAYSNVAVFDFYDVLTSSAGGGSDVGLSGGNHHRVWNGIVQHRTAAGVNHLVYPSGSDDHPNAAGDKKATAEFVGLLNAAYNAWKSNTGADTVGPRTRATRKATVRRGKVATLYYRVTDDKSPSATVRIRVKTRGGACKKTLIIGLTGTGRERRVRFTCHLRRGTYRYYVSARDLSGNAARTTLGHATLVVK